MGIRLGGVRHRRRCSPYRTIRPLRAAALQDLEGIKSLYAAAASELCLLMRAGDSFEIPVNDVMSRTHWLREYLDDYKLESRKDLGTRYDEDNVELEGRPAKSKGKGKFEEIHWCSEALGSLTVAPRGFPSSLTTGVEGILGAALAFSETLSFCSASCFTKEESGGCQQSRGGPGQEAVFPGAPAR